MHDYSKICRICMSSGSRDIFHRSNIDPNSPLERLLEKMRYVTMMKIEENDDLPRLICDLCIVQLNVAYNFKRQAVENDTKLRQYFIEHGITSHYSVPNSEIPNNSNLKNPTSSSNNNTESINNRHNTNISTTNVETASVRSSNFTASNSTPISPTVRRVTNSFPIMPIIVKTEPDNDILVDDLSDSVIENTRDGPLTESSISTENIINTGNRTQLNNSTSSMVYLNGYSINTLTPSSEVESYHNVSTNNNTANISDVMQLSSGSSISFGTSQNRNKRKTNVNIDKSNDKTKNDQQEKKSLSPAEITRKKIAQKRLGSQLKTRRVLKNCLETTLSGLKIDMAPPKGKVSREEMKKKLYFGVERKQRDSLEKQKSLASENSTKKNNRVYDNTTKILLNPFNTRKQNSAPSSISRRSSGQKMPTEKGRGKKNTRKSASDIQRTQIQLLQPKIEPPSKN
ncbi:myb-like protein I [Condylostylus longicornis]|uniref:myb-like protein I n=1 Tax=Condylostylus longicornis TaxID=2530218 RepID=UPI00244DC571|nr:myb-like protein I [Condylostylus longicornis]